MTRHRSQLNINIDPQLLIKLKAEATKHGKTLMAYITEKLQNLPEQNTEEFLEQRLLRIKKVVGIQDQPPTQEKEIGSIFTDMGAKRYGEVARNFFESHRKKKQLSFQAAFIELTPYLSKYSHSNPELVFNILLGTHVLTGLEMTEAYKKGSCAMRTALCDWMNNPLEGLNEAFLSAVITRSLS